jgi:hypothetical protein
VRPTDESTTPPGDPAPAPDRTCQTLHLMACRGPLLGQSSSILPHQTCPSCGHFAYRSSAAWLQVLKHGNSQGVRTHWGLMRGDIEHSEHADLDVRHEDTKGGNIRSHSHLLQPKDCSTLIEQVRSPRIDKGEGTDIAPRAANPAIRRRRL